MQRVEPADARACLRDRTAAAIFRADLLGREAAGLSLISVNILRGCPHRWRSARACGGAGDSPDQGQADGDGRRRRRFSGHARDAHPVRAFVGDAAIDAGVDVDDAVLAVSELASNVVLHAGTPFEVTVIVNPGRLRVEISDGSAILPALVRFVSSDSSHGRGMRIVEAVTSRWGTANTKSGKVVWFETTRAESD